MKRFEVITAKPSPDPVFDQFSPIVALHCSGSDGSQWSNLRAKLKGKALTLAPDLIGTPSRGHVDCRTNFTLAREAEHVVELMEKFGEPVHLVGHSYGGALALHIAKARPDLVRSLCLYEPTLFSLLATGGSEAQSLHGEIETLANSIRSGIEEGYSLFSAQVFTDFWGGVGAWQALSRTRREAMVAWIEKAPLDFHALLNEKDPEDIVGSDKPISLIVGSQSHPHTKCVADILSVQSKKVRMKELRGTGHLGPFTAREAFEHEVLSHLRAAAMFER